jgi:hypothetical protein
MLPSFSDLPERIPIIRPSKEAPPVTTAERTSLRQDLRLRFDPVMLCEFCALQRSTFDLAQPSRTEILLDGVAGSLVALEGADDVTRRS